MWQTLPMRLLKPLKQILSVIGSFFSSQRGEDLLLCLCNITPETLRVSQLRCVKLMTWITALVNSVGDGLRHWDGSLTFIHLDIWLAVEKIRMWETSDTEDSPTRLSFRSEVVFPYFSCMMLLRIQSSLRCASKSKYDVIRLQRKP